MVGRKGLNKNIILEAAEILLTEKGYDNLSLRDIAASLGVKPASLYNHIKGYDEIRMHIAIKASQKAGDILKKAVLNKSPDEAFVSGAIAYREFALNNPELYKAFVRKPELKNEEVMKAGFESFLPMRDIIMSYGISKRDMLHFIRGLRSMMHGFIELSNNGYMQRGNISRDESYEVIVKNYLKVLKEISLKNGEQAL